MAKFFDSIKVYGSGTTNSSSTFDTYNSGGTSTFTIKDDGNVGIGVSAPTSKLEISGKTYISQSLGVGTSPISQGIILGNTQPIYFGFVDHYIYNSGDALFVNGWNHLSLNSTQDLTFKTNNINSFFIDSNQNIGVNLTGTTTDSSKLHIKGSDSSSSNYGLKVQNSGGTDNLVVRNDGNVGIGTDSPTSKLSVYGSLTLSDKFLDFKNTLYPNIGTHFDALGNLTIEGPSSYGTGFSQLKVKNSAGNQSSIIVDSNNLGSSISLTRSGSSRYDIVTSNVNDTRETLYTPFLTYLDSSHRILSRTGTTEIMYLDATVNNSKVGIGTTSPSSKLEIKGIGSGSTTSSFKTFNSNGDLGLEVVDNGYTNIYGTLSIAPPTPYLYSLLTFNDYLGRSARLEHYNNTLSVYAGSGTQEIIHFDGATKRVGIGTTSSSSKLHIVGQGTGNTTTSLLVQNSGGSTNLLVRDDGNVGIGTTSPTSKLDINGLTGYDQLRLRTSFTPTGSTDTRGNVGDIAWDDNNFYWKTSTQWLRISGQTF